MIGHLVPDGGLDVGPLRSGLSGAGAHLLLGEFLRAEDRDFNHGDGEK
jgi:hypothetical protein